MCGGRGAGSLCDPEYWLETCVCTEEKRLSADVYWSCILCTAKRIVEILATCVEEVVQEVVDGCHLKGDSMWRSLWLDVERPTSALGWPFLSLLHKWAYIRNWHCREFRAGWGFAGWESDYWKLDNKWVWFRSLHQIIESMFELIFKSWIQAKLHWRVPQSKSVI